MFSILAAKPKSSEENKTGTWRSTKKPCFLRKDCIGCALCKLICPEGCIEGKDKNTYKADYLYCKGCGLCAFICPKQDIKMVSQEEEVT